MVKLGIIGCGYWGSNLIRAFSQQEGMDLWGVSDADHQKGAILNARYPRCRYFNQYSDMLKQDVDAVVIATDSGTHYQIAKDVLKAGKDVMIEKPMSLTSRDCEELIELAEKKKRILMVGHTFMYNAAVRKLKEYISQGELGEVYYLYSARLNLGKVRRDVNALWNFAPHDVSIILYLLDKEPLEVNARGFSYLQRGIEDVVFVTLTFNGGISAHIHISWLDPNKIRRMTVVGNRKMVVYDDMSSDHKIQIFDKGITRNNVSSSLEHYSNFGKFQLIHRAGDLWIPRIDFPEPLKVECRHFLDCVITRKRPLSDGYNGLRVVRILEAAQESMTDSGHAVEVK